MTNCRVEEAFDISDTEVCETVKIVLENTRKMKLKQQLIMLTGEFIGTAMLVFFGCIGCIDWGYNSSKLTFYNFKF